MDTPHDTAVDTSRDADTAPPPPHITFTPALLSPGETAILALEATGVELSTLVSVGIEGPARVDVLALRPYGSRWLVTVHVPSWAPPGPQDARLVLRGGHGLRLAEAVQVLAR